MVVTATVQGQGWLDRLLEIGKHGALGNRGDGRKPFNAAIDVLLVDDDELDLALTRRTLAASGLPHRIEVARDRMQALELLLSGRPDDAAWRRRGLSRRVVLLEPRLPAPGGVSLLRSIKASPRLSHIPVVVVAKAPHEEEIRTCLDLGASLYVAKPLTVANVIRILVSAKREWALAETVGRPVAA